MLQLLEKLLHTLCETTKVWDAFVANNGDIGYFSDLITATRASRGRIENVFHEIDEAFNDMENFRETLIDIKSECERLEDSLEFHLMVEANNSTAIWYLFPISIVSIFFMIPDSIIAFERNGWTFIGVVLILTAIMYFLCFLAKGRPQQQPWWGRLTTHATACLVPVLRTIKILPE
ncbi:hypothetical protein GQ44DRAFT_780272 [Phaeosphaeriaceae sp. PMI808]|nr:hypothetical protein GQ44DRAFT_780272 [Phaeosphaeriaceae sp. PMI808]